MASQAFSPQRSLSTSQAPSRDTPRDGRQDRLGNGAIAAQIEGQEVWDDRAGRDVAEGPSEGPTEAPPALCDGLHFFPGSDCLLLVVNGKVVTQVEARGGPALEAAQVGDEMPPGPTNSGSFTVAGTEAYHTPSWSWSKIDWGVKLIDKGDDVWYQMKSGKYGSVARDVGLSRDAVIRYNAELYGKAEVPKTWVFNDFGPMAVRYFRDLDGDGKRGPKEALEGEMIHTTPDNEAATAKGARFDLAESHGCIHIRPVDRDKLHKAGAFATGVPFQIHEYSERYTGA